MTRQTILGVLFILIGLVLLTVLCAPVYVAVRAHQPIAEPSVTAVVVALVTALFGAWLLPSSGVSATTANILVVAGPYLPSFGRRANSGETIAKKEEDNG